MCFAMDETNERLFKDVSLMAPDELYRNMELRRRANEKTRVSWFVDALNEPRPSVSTTKTSWSPWAKDGRMIHRPFVHDLTVGETWKDASFLASSIRFNRYDFPVR